MKRKKDRRNGKRLINFWVTIEQEELIKERAAKYFDGNMSEYIRFASIKLRPKKADLNKV